MEQLRSLAHLIGGHPLPAADDGPAGRTRLILLAALVSAALAAVYGFAVGGTDLSHALSNLYRMPVVVLLAGAAALPAGLVAWKLGGGRSRPSDLALGLASGTLSASLVLAVLSPVVALYFHTTEWVGPMLALGAAALAALVGLGVLARAVLLRAEDGPTDPRALLPLVVLMFVHLATLTQLVAISEIMPVSTPLDDGIEGLAAQR